MYTDGSFFLTFFILYSNFLPISMYVTVEICNYFQAYFIEKDVALYDEVSNMPALARTSNMNSDLGMVEYVFSDKTGTLTDNVMRFRRCSIGGVVYGPCTIGAGDEGGVGSGAGKGVGIGKDPSQTMDSMDALHAKSRGGKKQPLAFKPLSALTLAAASIYRGSPPALAPTAEFLLILALCHTMILDGETGAMQVCHFMLILAFR